eukprot:3650924-Pleurochrysis_carterae.AAC.1
MLISRHSQAPTTKSTSNRGLPRAPKAGHAGTSTSSMLSPIKETGERTEPGSAERRGTRSAGKQPP